MNEPTRKPRVAVVFGGRSSEHGISCVTAGGILGKVVSVGEDELEVEIATGVRVRVIRSTLAQVVTKTEPVAANS